MSENQREVFDLFVCGEAAHVNFRLNSNTAETPSP
jgi:hypothetical protein